MTPENTVCRVDPDDGNRLHGCTRLSPVRPKPQASCIVTPPARPASPVFSALAAFLACPRHFVLRHRAGRFSDRRKRTADSRAAQSCRAWTALHRGAPCSRGWPALVANATIRETLAYRGQGPIQPGPVVSNSLPAGMVRAVAQNGRWSGCMPGLGTGFGNQGAARGTAAGTEGNAGMQPPGFMPNGPYQTEPKRSECCRARPGATDRTRFPKTDHRPIAGADPLLSGSATA